VLNITVSSDDDNFESPRTLNYINSRDILIRSAVVASCALPGGFRPAQLLWKHPTTKEITPVSESEYIDGSIGGDIPLLHMSQAFGCNYYIVAQANPHVLTGYKLKSLFGSGAVGKAMDPVISTVVDQIVYVLPVVGKVGRVVAGLLDQPYRGDVTVMPDLTLGGLMRILSNPTPEFMDASKEIGERAIYPYLGMIKNHVKIELALDRAYKELTAACYFSTSQTNLRRLQLERNARPRRRLSITSKTPLVKPHTDATRKSDTLRKASGIGALKASQHTEQITALYDQGQSRPDFSPSCPTRFKLGSDESDGLSDDESTTSVTPPPEADESDSDDDPYHRILRLRSAPSSPRPTSKQFFDSSSIGRSPSSTGPPISLMMTPTDERSVSPHLRRSNKLETDVPKSSLPAATKVLQPQNGRPFHIELPKPVRHKRSASTGLRGVPQ
jgi:predicted acylesterase/phospholipase RssA